MPTYTTLPESADLIQDRTQAFKIVPISDDVDLGYFWQKAAGNPDGKLKVTLIKPNNTTVVKTAEDDEVAVVNTSPPKIKVLIEPTDVDFVGNLRLFAEFKIDDSWVQADVIALPVTADPIPAA